MVGLGLDAPIQAQTTDGRPAALGALRARLGLVLLLLALAGVAWWATAEQMAGMDAGPGTDLGALGWFAGIWVVMMAAMMFPSVAPTVALYSTMTRRESLARPLIFAAAYLVVWGLVGLLSYGVFAAGKTWLATQLAWDSGGRWLAGAVLLLAGVYELTPLKNACLRRCRSPLGFLLSAWRGGRTGALTMGAKHAAWCVGCCWALMAALFALGVMSILWMGVIAAVIAVEKSLPWRRPVVFGTAAFLTAMGLLVLIAPHDLPGLVVPSTGSSMMAMH